MPAPLQVVFTALALLSLPLYFMLPLNIRGRYTAFNQNRGLTQRFEPHRREMMVEGRKRKFAGPAHDHEGTAVDEGKIMIRIFFEKGPGLGFMMLVYANDADGGA